MRTLRPVALALLLLACGTTPRLEQAPAAEPSPPDARCASVSDRGVASAPDAGGEVAAGSAVATPALAPSCEARIAERALEAPSARHEAYLRRLPEVLVHARIDPVLYLSWPDEGAAASERTAEATATRHGLERSAHPLRDLRRLLAARDDPAFMRAVLLSDGYLFSDRPALALALSAEVRLTHLFDAPQIVRSRDGATEVLVRGDEGYLEADGSVARLRLNDRVSADTSGLAEARALDLEVVREQTGALRTLPTAVGPDAAAFDLAFPDGTRRPSLVELRDGRTEVVCIGGSMQTLRSTRADAARFWARHAAMTAAARALVGENARFDEPIDEPEGVQEDGVLRRAWTEAYLRGDRTFSHRDVEYPVFDAEGRAIPPQVCVDFVFDAWERGAGTWYRGADDRPGRTAGALDFDRAASPNAGAMPRRSIAQLLEYARNDDTVIERFDVPRRERVALREGGAYARALARTADAFREGDALIIHGLREQDMRLHYHAVLVIRTEPMTGVPMVVADNQGRPHFRTLVGAMRAAPLRSIDHRLRMNVDALSALSADSAFAERIVGG